MPISESYLLNSKLVAARSQLVDLNAENIKTARQILSQWVSTDLSKTKEKNVQAQFLIRIMSDCLGYGLQTSGQEQWNLTPEISIQGDSADGGLGFYSTEKSASKTIVVVELKDAATSLDKKQLGRDRKESPIEQAYRYASKVDECKWIIVTNFREIRLFNKSRSSVHYEHFLISKLTQDEEFRRFYTLLSRENLISVDGPSLVDELLAKTTVQDKQITDEFHNDYKKIRTRVFTDLEDKNTNLEPKLILEKAQKLLDRFTFVFFAEDGGLLPARTSKILVDAAENRFDDTDGFLWKQAQGLFKAIDKGNSSLRQPINAYNGGMFAPDPIMDALIVPDATILAILELADYDFESELNVNLLGHIFEQSITDIEVLRTEIENGEIDKQVTKRKKSGIFYTPEHITRYLIEQTVESYLQEFPERLESIKIVDPACGSGAFLNQAHTYLKALYHTKGLELQAEVDERIQESSSGKSKTKRDFTQPALEISDGELVGRKDIDLQYAYTNDAALLRHIYGVDLNAESVEITKLSLWLKTARKTEPLASLDDRIKCGNSLVEDSEVAGTSAFNWQEAFPEVSVQGGFDIVIGNPPWVFTRNGKISVHEKAYYSKAYDTAAYQLNTYSLFIEQGFKQLRPRGRFGFIVPNTWLTISTFGVLRKFLLENTADLRIINIHGKVFEEANVDCCLLLFTKGDPTNVTLGEMRMNEIELMPPVKPEVFNSPTKIINISLHSDPTVVALLEKMKKNSLPLSSFARVSTGIKAYQVGKGKPAQTKQDVIARIFHASSKKDATYVPYLQGVDVRRYGIGRSKGQWISYGDWLAEPRKSIDFTKERILVRQIPAQPPYCIHAALTSENAVNDINSMVIQDFKVNSLALLGWLNSKPVSFWFAKTFDKLQRGLFPQFKVGELKQFPVPVAISDNADALQKLVQSYLDKHAALENFQTSSSKYLYDRYALDFTKGTDFSDWLELSSAINTSTLNPTSGEELWKYLAEKMKELQELTTSTDQAEGAIDELVMEIYNLDETEKEAIRVWGATEPEVAQDSV